MLRTTLTGIISVCLFLAACQTQPPPKPEMAPAVTTQAFPAYRDSLIKANPDARVGLVTVVMAQQHMATLGVAQSNDFRLDDYVTFFDSKYRLIAEGRVTSSNNGKVEVHYDPPTATGRDPAPGDLAVRIYRAVD